MPDIAYGITRRLFKLRPQRAKRVERRTGLTATMSDGAVLLADHYVPDGDTTAPLVLIRCPYGRSAFGLLGRALAYEGFQVVFQSCRGTSGSGGDYDRPFRAEHADGRDTVTWLRRQSFYPGRFATFGGSYLGYTQLALPPEAKTDLFAAVLQIAPTSTADIVWPNGALALATSLGWSTGAHRNSQSLRNLLRERGDRRHLREAGITAPLIHSYTRATSTRVGFLEDWWTHPDPAGPFWNDEDHQDSLDTYDCPVLVQTGWFDLFLEASIAQYERLAAHGTDARLTVGPWTHGTFTSKGLRHVLAEAADFLRAALGLAEPLTEPPVHLRDARTGRPHLLAEWPPANKPEHHYLTTAALQPDPPTAPHNPTSFTYDPNDPTPQLGGALLEPGGGPVDNSSLEARADVITFDTPAFTARAQYTGTPSVELWVSSDVPAPQLFVRLNVVDASGVSKNLTDTIMTVRTDSNELACVHIALPPTCVQLDRGERFRMLIAGGSYPRFARSPGTGESPAMARDFRTARIDIHHDVAHPSRLTMPRVPGPDSLELDPGAHHLSLENQR